MHEEQKSENGPRSVRASASPLWLGVCLGCWYPAGTSPRCSECGRPIVYIDAKVDSQLRKIAAQRRTAVAWMILLVGCLLLLFAIPIVAFSTRTIDRLDMDMVRCTGAWAIVSAVAVVLPLVLTRRGWRFRSIPVEAVASLAAASWVYFASDALYNADEFSLRAMAVTLGVYICPIACPLWIGMGIGWELTELSSLHSTRWLIVARIAILVVLPIPLAVLTVLCGYIPLFAVMIGGVAGAAALVAVTVSSAMRLRRWRYLSRWALNSTTG